VAPLECFTPLWWSTEGHSAEVNTVAFSSDGKQLASGGRDYTVHLWDPTTGNLVETLVGHRGWINAVAFSPDGAQLATASRDAEVRVWDTRSGELLHMLQIHEFGAYSLAFSPDGKYIITGSGKGPVRLWIAATGQLKRLLKGHSDKVTSVAFSHNGALIVSGSADKTVRVWDTETGRGQHVLQGPRTFIDIWVGFSLDGKQVRAGSYDIGAEALLYRWDTASGVPNAPLGGGHVSVSMAFSPDDKWVACGCDDKIVRVWDMSSGALSHKFRGHRDEVWAVAFSPDNTQLVTGDCYGSLRTWALATESI